MKRIVINLFLLLSILLFVSCEEGVQLEDTDQIVSLDELDNTAHFRSGALAHILEGELNRQGQAVGYHYEGLPSKKGVAIVGTRTNPNEHGVYEAKVIIAGVEKKSNGGRSSFFPIEWSAQDVVDAINEAYENKSIITGNTYAGLANDGIEIRMYLDGQEKIISAFPVY